MKNKSTLVLIEYIVMLLVFVLAATVCVRMFVLSDRLSRKYEATDRAVLVAQNTAEYIKKSGVAGVFTKGHEDPTGAYTRTLFYDKDWTVTEEADAEFIETVTCAAEDEFLFRAEIVISTAEGTEFFRLPVAVQTEAEVAADETD